MLRSFSSSRQLYLNRSGCFLILKWTWTDNCPSCFYVEHYIRLSTSLTYLPVFSRILSRAVGECLILILQYIHNPLGTYSDCTPLIHMGESTVMSSAEHSSRAYGVLRSNATMPRSADLLIGVDSFKHCATSRRFANGTNDGFSISQCGQW